MNKTLGFIGAGNMATAIINGILVQKAETPDLIFVFDLDDAKLALMREKGVRTVSSCQELTKQADIIVLAVKPQNYDEVLNDIRPAVDANKTFVTIAAGISIAYIRSRLGTDVPAVRVMPNTPLLLGKGATAMCRSENIAEDDFQKIYQMFALSGVVEEMDEQQMNAVIAVNGSSPAYIYYFAKAMRDYAVSVGIDETKALNLICQTLEGSAAMLRESGDSPDTLIGKVCSKGGTTIEAMNILQQHHVEDSIVEAMQACTRRAEELGK